MSLNWLRSSRLLSRLSWPLLRRRQPERCDRLLIDFLENAISPETGLAKAVISWEAGGSRGVELKVGSPQGTLVASGGPKDSVETGWWIEDGQTFFLVDTTSKAVLATATAHISARASLVFDRAPVAEGVSGKSAAVQISWAAPGHSETELRLGSEPGQLVARGGAQGKLELKDWLEDGQQFFLVDARSRKVLASNVFRLSILASLISNPDPVRVGAAGPASVTLRWMARGFPEVELRVGSPRGKLLVKGESCGSVETGRWVSQDTSFHLVDARTGDEIVSRVVRTLRESAQPRAFAVSGDGSSADVTDRSIPPVTRSENSLTKHMRRDWDRRSSENALHFVNSAREDWSESDFFESGRKNVEEFILTDLSNICRGRDPKTLEVLEIGCGVGRMTRSLAGLFGTVCSVDVSPEMVRKARHYLRDYDNVSLFVNNGKDLSVVGDRRFDFALSLLVFQHIPSKSVVENYIAETARVLRPGSLFKFQVQGFGACEQGREDTWLGVGFAPEEMAILALRNGFQPRHLMGSGGQYFTLWFFRKGPAIFRGVPDPAALLSSGRCRTTLSWDAPGIEHVEVRLWATNGQLFVQGSSWGSQELEFSAEADIPCYLLDASTGEVLSQTVVRTPRRDEAEPRVKTASDRRIAELLPGDSGI